MDNTLKQIVSEIDKYRKQKDIVVFIYIGDYLGDLWKFVIGNKSQIDGFIEIAEKEKRVSYIIIKQPYYPAILLTRARLPIANIQLRGYRIYSYDKFLKYIG